MDTALGRLACALPKRYVQDLTIRIFIVDDRFQR
jgi:hypothetical protein